VIGYLDRRLKILEYEQTLYNNENKEISAILKTVTEIKEILEGIDSPEYLRWKRKED